MLVQRSMLEHDERVRRTVLPLLRGQGPVQSGGSARPGATSGTSPGATVRRRGWASSAPARLLPSSPAAESPARGSAGTRCPRRSNAPRASPRCNTLTHAVVAGAEGAPSAQGVFARSRRPRRPAPTVASPEDTSVRVWIDVERPAQVQFLLPLKPGLEARRRGGRRHGPRLWERVRAASTRPACRTRRSAQAAGREKARKAPRALRPHQSAPGPPPAPRAARRVGERRAAPLRSSPVSCVTVVRDHR